MTEERKRARLIYNPTSGQEIIKKNIAEVLDVLENIGPFKRLQNLFRHKKKLREQPKLILI